MTNGAKNHPQDKTNNRPQDRAENRLNIINPVSFTWRRSNPVQICVAVISEVELEEVLMKRFIIEPDWSSRVRLRGLMLLIDYICRNLKNGSISISADLAHQFVSSSEIAVVMSIY
jgi:hypothetical protein